jgi:hypothetical protein
MADEPVTEPVVEPEVEPEVTPEPEVAETEPHPLEPGGRRFSEVYGEMKDARREAGELRERLARVEGQLTAQQPKPAVAQHYTEAQLQAAVDTGKITPAQMASQISWQHNQNMAVEIERKAEIKQRNQSALNEINQYVDKVPSLMQTSSPEFIKVSQAAREIAAEWGREVTDPLVQRRALREAMGNLEQLTRVKSAANTPRGANNMDGENRGSNGQTNSSGKPDPLKDVPQMYKDHWKRLGYDQKRMVEEAAFIKPRRAR